MAEFLGQDFLLSTEAARRLYHEYAAQMPIYDYHCHLPPAEIAGDRQYSDLTDIWLGGDHYKWRAMRIAGIPERLITGDASPREKFRAWASVVPQTLGNPLYHWTHLELRRWFGITELLTPESADRIREEANRQLALPEFRVRSLLSRMKVRFVGTTDDPLDDLSAHSAIAADPDIRDLQVRPSFRPDRAFTVPADAAPTAAYWERLAEVAGTPRIVRFAHLQQALAARLDFFGAAGCRISDHALVSPVNQEATPGLLDEIVGSVAAGQAISPEARAALATAVLSFLGQEYSRRGWVMQLHIGALRSTRARMLERLGPDSGFDSIAAPLDPAPLAGFLDRLDRQTALPRTILYSLNPADNEVLASMAGSFCEADASGGAPGKVQHGSAWWFNDQLDGMKRQMTSLAGIGLLSRFVGMLTDSRSFLSFPRHEYFRRLLCDIVGAWVEAGEAPADYAMLGAMVQDISFRNAHAYFGVPEVTE